LAQFGCEFDCVQQVLATTVLELPDLIRVVDEVVELVFKTALGVNQAILVDIFVNQFLI